MYELRSRPRPLQVLLGTHTMMVGRLTDGVGFVLPAGEAEEKLSQLLSCVIQNVAQHPDNRTMLYKVIEMQNTF